MKQLISDIESAIRQAEQELKNTISQSNNWYLTKGKLNGYKYILNNIKKHHTNGT